MGRSFQVATRLAIVTLSIVPLLGQGAIKCNQELTRQATMTKKAQVHTTPVLAVINMKGGVGKTTITGNVFRELFRLALKRTLLIDFDAQFNLTQLLLGRGTYEKLKDEGKTVWNVLEPPPATVFKTSTKDTIEPGEVDEFTWRLRYVLGHENVELRLLPGVFRIAQLNLREKPETLRTPRQRFSAYVNAACSRYELIVLDCNPSSSFLTRTAIECATHLLIPVRPDKYSLLGVEMILEYMNSLPRLVHKPEYFILLNALETSPKPSDIEAQLRSHSVFGARTLVAGVPRSDLLLARADYTGFAVERKVKNRNILTRLLASVAREIAQRIELV